jgi:hypothetical protein
VKVMTAPINRRSEIEQALREESLRKRQGVQ